MNAAHTEILRRTPLHGLHLELGGKMVPFAGYDMPVQYHAGILKEHLHTRSQAGLFDVSHMGQRLLTGPDDEAISAALELVTPGDFKSLGNGRIRYSLLLNEQGGIVDDFGWQRAWPDRAAREVFFLSSMQLARRWTTHSCANA